MFKKIQIPAEWLNEPGVKAVEVIAIKEDNKSENKSQNKPQTVEIKSETPTETQTTMPMGKWIPPKKNLGASQFAAALGLNKFLDSGTLKNQLEKGYPFQEIPRLQFGNQKESLAKYFYQKLTGNKIRRASLVKDKVNPQIVGVCDGLIGWDGGLEIKCHFPREDRVVSPLRVIPVYYLIQIAGYLHLYDRLWWDFMSCCFNDKEEFCTCRIIRVHREEVHDAWTNEWYPKLIEFVKSVQWSK